MSEPQLLAALQAWDRNIGYSKMERMRWAVEAATQVAVDRAISDYRDELARKAFEHTGQERLLVLAKIEALQHFARWCGSARKSDS